MTDPNHFITDDFHSSGIPLKRALKDKEAAFYIGMSDSWLRHSRMEGARPGRIPGPRFIKIGRSVRYLREDLDLWLEKFQKHEHLAEQYLARKLESRE